MTREDTGVEVVTYMESEIPSELRARAAALREEAWPGMGDSPHDSALHPVTMLLVSPQGEVTSALDVLSKDIRHGGHAYRAAGLSAVATAGAHRGRGHGRQLVAAARRFIAESGADVGLFTCDRPLRAFYESAGWSVLKGAVLVGGTPQEPFPSDRPGFDKVTMAGFFTERALRGADAFRYSRIGLYSGEIDRLW
ncbi:GNAT family N-acetyltransferase [Streptomyces sp. NPDC026206]|uniref:GNAT family N-acetyltransferase n=1 Tax=Streptomyces sp. NPDC026206 TaxID=3157089 RepID=UPI0033D94B39